MARKIHKKNRYIKMIRDTFADFPKNERDVIWDVYGKPHLKAIRVWRQAARALRAGNLGYKDLKFDLMGGQPAIYERQPGTKDYIFLGFVGSAFMRQIIKHSEKCVDLLGYNLDNNEDGIRIFNTVDSYHDEELRSYDLEQEKVMTVRIQSIDLNEDGTKAYTLDNLLGKETDTEEEPEEVEVSGFKLTNENGSKGVVCEVREMRLVERDESLKPATHYRPQEFSADENN